MDPLASTDQFADWLGVTLTGSDLTRADSILVAASSLVRSEAGRTWEDETVPDDVVAVVLQAAERKYRNPAGETQKTVGDVSVSYGNSAAVGLYLTDDEKIVVRRYRETASGGLWTLRTTRTDPNGEGDLGTLYDDTWYMDTNLSGTKLPWLDADQLA